MARRLPAQGTLSCSYFCSGAARLFFTEFHGVVIAREEVAEHEGLVGFGTPLVKLASTGVCIQLIETGPS